MRNSLIYLLLLISSLASGCVQPFSPLSSQKEVSSPKTEETEPAPSPEATNTGPAANPGDAVDPGKQALPVPTPRDSLDSFDRTLAYRFDAPPSDAGGTARTFDGAQDRIAMGTHGPIDPKTDNAEAGYPGWVVYRLRYGPDFSLVLPHNENFPKPPTSEIERPRWFLQRGGILNLKLFCETRIESEVTDEPWEACKNGERIRLVFTPQNGTEANKISYETEITDVGVNFPGANAAFENLGLGLGIIELYHLDGPTIRLRQPTEDEPAERAYPLGSFELAPLPELKKLRRILLPDAF